MSLFSRFSFLRSCFLCLCIGLSSLLMAMGKVPLELKNLETVPCPPEYENLTTSGSGTPANCFFIQGQIQNRSGKQILNADVFGRLYDANGNDVMPERTRLGAIDEVPPGESPFAIRISVPQDSPLPLRLEQFKASGFQGVVRR